MKKLILALAGFVTFGIILAFILCWSYAPKPYTIISVTRTSYILNTWTYTYKDNWGFKHWFDSNSDTTYKIGQVIK